MGWRVKVEAISGERQHSKKSWSPLATWYSGRYLPAISNCQRDVASSTMQNVYLGASPTLEASRPSGLNDSAIHPVISPLVTE